MRKGVLVLHTRNPVTFTLMLPLASHLTNWTRGPVSQLGNKSVTDNKAREDTTRPQPTSRNRLRVQNRKNDNYCVNCVTGQEDCLCIRPSRQFEVSTSVASKRETVNLHVNSCVFSPVHVAEGYPQKKGVNPNSCHYTEIKYVKAISCVGRLSSVNLVTNVPTVAPDLPVVPDCTSFGKSRKP